MLSDLGVERKALIVITEPNREIYLATRNLASARAVPVSSLNALDVLDAENVVIERQAIEKLERRLS
jgi:ribosomal protein L4